MRCVRPYLVLTALWGVYFHPLVLHPADTFYAADSDFLAEHLPAKRFLNREWREAGELPLWNPYHFCGTPFVHDIQVGCFYPPYAVIYLVPEGAVGAALSWVIALHVLAAGVFTLIYTRSDGFGEVGGLVAAIGFMLSAKWMTHLFLAGHTVTVGLAWLPLVLLGLERAGRTGRVWPVIGVGVALALLVLGTHPQWTFYAGVFAATWTIPPGWSRRAVGRWLACGLGVVAVAIGLCAVQLLPTLDASRLSARTGGVEASGSLSLGLPTFLGLVGPSLVADHPQSWETRGIFGTVWLAAAVAAPTLAGGRARWRFGVFLGLVFFSVGGAVVVEGLPGFNLFRVPGRMLLIATFPLAILAGMTTDVLIRSGWGADARRGVWRSFGLVGAVAVLPAVVVAVLGWWNSPGRVGWVPGVVGWASTAALLPVAVWLGRTGAVSRPFARGTVWVVVLLAELVGPTVLLPDVRPQAEIDPEPDAVAFLASRARPGEGRVLDRDTGEADRRSSLLGVGAPLALIDRVEAVRGYNPLDVRSYREFLGFVAGDPGPVRGNSPLTQQVVPDFEIANRELLDLMAVRYFASPAGEPSPGGWRPVFTDAGPVAVPPLKPGAPPRLPPYTVFENPAAFPRAFVVPNAAPMPAGHELDAILACDFRRTVLLTTPDPLPPAGAGSFRSARITDHRPNRVVIEPDGQAGFVVLSDVWFPGWVCRVDGVEVPVYRANHTFRAVAIPAKSRSVVFSFEPRSYRIGWWVSASVLAVVVGVGVATAVRRVAGRLSSRGG